MTIPDRILRPMPIAVLLLMKLQTGACYHGDIVEDSGGPVDVARAFVAPGRRISGQAPRAGSVSGQRNCVGLLASVLRDAGIWALPLFHERQSRGAGRFSDVVSLCRTA